MKNNAALTNRNTFNSQNISIGTYSRFSDDIWDISEFLPNTTLKNSHKKINFSYIENDEMKYTCKLYAYHKLGEINAKTVHSRINSALPTFFKYSKLYGINSFKEVSLDVFLHYNLWLKEEYITKNGRKSSNDGAYRCSYVVEEIIKLGQRKNWNVPIENMFVEINSQFLWNTKDDINKNKFLPIPENIFDNIITCASKNEKNVITKAGILLQAKTGLRISEILSLKEGCVKTNSDGTKYLEVKISKTEKGEPVIHKIFINYDPAIETTVKELSIATCQLRKESGLKELFLIRYAGNIKCYKADFWTQYRLPSFIKRHNIRDKSGNLYPLKSHQFRSTFVKILVQRGVGLVYIQKHFNHVSIEMTIHYLTLKREEIQQMLKQMILKPDSKIVGIRANDIKETLGKLYRGKTEKKIKEVMDNLSKTISLNPLPTGACLFDIKRGNCTEGDGCFFYNCPNYITDIEFYPILKKELELIEQEINRFEELKMPRVVEKLQIKKKYLKPLVEELEAQIEK